MTGLDLKKFTPFAEIMDAETALLEELLERRELVEGEVVVTEGDEADGLVLVEGGSLRMTSERTSDLGDLGPGSHMGGLSLGSLGRREVTLTAAEPTTVLLLTRSAFMRLSEDAPRAATRVLEAVLRDLGAILRAGLDDLV